LIVGIKSPLRVVVGSNDDVTPPELCKAFYDGAREPKKWVLVEGADHSFNEHRVLLIKAVLDWLKVTL